ncbi:aminotransferase class V-fold PLP-dependent enzyme [Desertibaculum subflavum]|uniref:aminotransferase class V-fold PLP-dependent enzyme n=1 Tax=Desertibaculum subflavum TaxID=2268458 RepID=UPI000E668284
MSIDLSRVRSDTPGTANVVHLNNAGAALPPRQVLQAVQQHLEREAAIGGYEAAAEAAGAIEGVYGSIARLVNAAPDEIAVVENATRAWDMAFYSFGFGPGDRILTAQAEYASNYLAFLQVARRTGAVIEVVPNDNGGALDPHALERMIDGRVKLIAITHIPTNGGLVNPAEAVGRIARAHGIPYLLDACQSVGQMPVDVEALGCDMLSATGRKFLRGPRGTGFLYVRRGLIGRLEPPFIDLHSADWTGADTYEFRADARRFENWECFVAGKIGLGAAADYAMSLGLDAIRERAWSLADRLRTGLAAIPGTRLRDLGDMRSAIVSFTIDRIDPAAVKQRLAQQTINVTVSGLTSTRLDMAARQLQSVVRASPHYYNSEEEIDRALEAIAGIARSA